MKIASGSTLFIIGMFILIVSSLGVGLYYLATDKGNSKKTVKALTVRVALSVALFLSLWVAFSAGLISPHGLIP